MRIPDNYDLWEQHDTELERQLEELPVCSECAEHIQADFYFEINDETICPECMMENHRKRVEDFV